MSSRVDLVWVSLTANPAPAKIRRYQFSPDALGVGEYSRALWPHVELALRRTGKTAYFLPLEDVLWPKSLIRALLELRPRAIHYQYHPEFWPGRGFLAGDFTHICKAVGRGIPDLIQLVTPHSTPSPRIWGRDRFKGMALISRKTIDISVDGKSLAAIPGVRGTVSRNSAPAEGGDLSHLSSDSVASASVGGLSAGRAAEELASAYFPC